MNLESLTKEEIMEVLKTCLNAMENCHAYPSEYFEEPTEVERKVLSQTGIYFSWQNNGG